MNPEINPYLGDLMMGVLVASTAFCGLTGVVIGQIKESNMIAFSRKQMKLILSVSFVLGVGAVLLAILWFLTPVQTTSRLSPLVVCPWFLFVQVILFVAVVVDFWFSE